MRQACRKCGKVKELSEFHKSKAYLNGHRTICKDCRKPKKDGRGKYNICEDCGIMSRNKVCHKCKIKRKTAKGICKRCDNPIDTSRSTILCTEHLNYANERNITNYDPVKKRKYYLENKDHILKVHKKYEQKLRDSGDLNYRLRRNSLVRVQDFIKHVKGQKKYSVSEHLGCSYEDLQLHLELKFYDNPETGEEMSWDNYGINGWHIDHIVPLSKFNLEDEFQFSLANNYQNLQPMWSRDNILKSNTLEEHVIWLDGIPYVIERN